MHSDFLPKSTEWNWGEKSYFAVEKPDEQTLCKSDDQGQDQQQQVMLTVCALGMMCWEWLFTSMVFLLKLVARQEKNIR